MNIVFIVFYCYFYDLFYFIDEVKDNRVILIVNIFIIII